jgi:hypothetical protein
MRLKAKLAAVVSLVSIASGCAAPAVKLSDADRARVKTVRISDTVQKPPEMFLYAPSGGGRVAAMTGMMFGAIGGAIGGAASAESQKGFAAVLEKHSVSIEKIVREEVERALRASGKFALADAGDTSAPVVNIVVLQYGFAAGSPLDSDLWPVLTMKCDLVDNSGRLLWTATEQLLRWPESPQPTPMEDLRDNPKTVEAQWRKAARFLADKMLGEL